MAERTRSYHPTDWSIWTYVPEEGSFVLDYSQLDGPDVLGTTGGSVVQSDVEISEMVITEGGDVTYGFLTPVTPTLVEAVISFSDFTLETSRQFLNGQDIYVTLKNEQQDPDPTYGFNTLMFRGKISSFNARPQSDSDFVIANLSAVSDLSWQLNTQINIDTVTDVYMGNQIKNAADLVGVYIYPTTYFSGTGPYQFGSARNVIRTLGEWLDNYQKIAFVPAIDKVEIFNVDVDGEVSYEIGYSDFYYNDIFNCTLDETNIYEIDFGWNGQGTPTGVSFTLATDEAIQYQIGSTNTSSSSDAFIYVDTLDVNGLAQLESAGQKMISMTKEYGALTVSTETAKIYQDITFDWAGPVDLDASVQVKNLGYVGAKCNVSMTQFGLDKEYIITGRTIEITPDNWTTTYNLWKGFTN